MKRTNLHRVFIHELGHYIAQELNHELYDGQGRIGSIEFEEVELPYGVDYIGKTNPEILEGQSKKDKLVNLPEKIAVLVYGCYFQSLFMKTTLKFCLDLTNQSANGFDDAQYIAGGLYQFCINEKRRQLYPFLHEEYFNEIKQNRGNFDTLFEINYLDFLEKADFGYRTDLSKLYEYTTEFRAEHKSDFNDFVNRIKIIIDWKKTCGNNVSYEKH